MIVSFRKLTIVEARSLHVTYYISYSPSTSRKRVASRDVRVPDGSNSAVITDLDPNLDYDVNMYTTTSVGEGPRSQPISAPFQSATTESSSDPTLAIIGGVVTVVIVLIIAITVAVVAIVALFLKNRHGDSSTKKPDE